MVWTFSSNNKKPVKEKKKNNNGTENTQAKNTLLGLDCRLV